MNSAKLEKVPEIAWDYESLCDTIRRLPSFDWEHREVSNFKFGNPTNP